MTKPTRSDLPSFASSHSETAASRTASPVRDTSQGLAEASNRHRPVKLEKEIEGLSVLSPSLEGSKTAESLGSRHGRREQA